MRTRQEKIALLMKVIKGEAPKSILQPNKVLNINIGHLSDNEPRFIFDGKPVNMGRAFELIYSDNIDYSVTKN